MFEWLNEHKKTIMTYTLWLVIPSFVLMYGYGECAKPQQYRWVAKVNGHEIPEYEWRNTIENIERRMQQMRQFQQEEPSREEIRRQALETAITSALISQKAREWGIGATDEEVAQSIFSIPEFQNENGQFDKNRYYQLLAYNGMVPAQFEAEQRENLTRSKMATLIQQSFQQAAPQKQREEARRNQKITIEYLAFEPSGYTDEVEADEEGLAAFFEENKEDYRIPEQRRIDYARFDPKDFESEASSIVENATVFDRLLKRYFSQNQQRYEIPDKVRVEYITYNADAFADTVEVPEDEAREYYSQNTSKYQTGPRAKVRYVQTPLAAAAEQQDVTEEAVKNYYDSNIQRYSHGEQVKARHILLRVTPELSAGEEEEIKNRLLSLRGDIAEGRLTFEQAAEEFSQDTVSALQGGDLGYFERGRMVPAFEEAAFSLPLGQMSEPVKTQFGYHLIKVEDRKEEGTDPLEDVRDEIADTLKMQRAIQTFRDMAANLGALDEVSSEYEIRETDWFARGDDIPGVPEKDKFYFASAALSPAPGRNVSFAGNTLMENLYLIQPVQREERRPMTFEEARDQVIEDIQAEKAEEIASNAAQEDAGRIRDATVPLETIAEERGLEIQTSGLFGAGDSFVPGLGSRPASLANQALTLEPGQTAGPFRTSTGQHIIRLLAKEPAHLPDLEEVYGAVREDFLRERSETQAKVAANQFADELFAQHKPLAEGAAAANIEHGTTGFFKPNDVIPGLGRKMNINQAAFELAEEGALSDAIEETVGFSPDGQSNAVEAYYIIELKEIKEPYLPELEEVREDAKRDYKLRLAEEVAEARAAETLETIRAAMASGPVSATQTVELNAFKDDPEAEGGNGAVYRGPYEITGSGQVPGIGRAPALVKTALRLEPGGVSSPVHNYRTEFNEDGEPAQGPMTGVYIVQVLGKSEAGSSEEDEMQNSFAQFMEQQAQTRAFGAWIGEVSRTATIEYNQDLLGGYEEEEETMDEESGGEMATAS